MKSGPSRVGGATSVECCFRVPASGAGGHVGTGLEESEESEAALLCLPCGSEFCRSHCCCEPQPQETFRSTGYNIYATHLKYVLQPHQKLHVQFGVDCFSRLTASVLQTAVYSWYCIIMTYFWVKSRNYYWVWFFCSRTQKCDHNCVRESNCSDVCSIYVPVDGPVTVLQLILQVFG